jgi:hypothetical protein
MITVDLVSCRQSRRPCSINSLPTSQVEVVEVEVVLRSRGSRKVHVEKTSIAYPSMIRTHTLQILEIAQGSKPGIDRSFCEASLSCNHELRMLIHWALLILLPIVVDSSDCWTSPFSVPRLYDDVAPLCPLLPQSRSRRRDLTGWPLSSSVLATPDTLAGLDDCCSHCGHKREALLPRTTSARYHHRSCPPSS